MTLLLHVPARLLAPTLFALAAAGSAQAQVFQSATSKVPQGPPFNNSWSEAVEFADVDLDGDFDCATADGGDCCNDQNRLWINLGGAQGGSIGFFQDETAARFPAVLDTSRDMDFADLDADGDQDLYTANDSTITPQACRFWINMGGLQGGSAGFFQDQTSTRWLELGQNNGSTTHSSIAPNLVLASGGYIDWSCDGVLGDLDADGDLDLVQTSVAGAFAGNVPARLFLNDGSGAFEEFNPSGYQLLGASIPNFAPGLWSEGLHVQNTVNTTGLQCDIAGTPLGAEFGDLDEDFDLDLVHGARDVTPRVFVNRQQEQGGQLGWRDVTWAALTQTATGGVSYEQELGDFDDDGDLDLYGLSWSSFDDVVCRNDGHGVFGPFALLPGSNSDESEGEFLDYDNDGDLDLFVANFSGQERMYRNEGAPAWSFSNATASALPVDNTTSLQADACDVDADGDSDVMVANDLGQANVLLENLSQVGDVRAPRLPHLEQARNRSPSSDPTRVRVQVFDNAPWTVTQFNAGRTEYRVDSGPIQVGSLHYVGGNLFRGEIPGGLAGVIRYRTASEDAYGNAGVSPWRVYSSSNAPADTFCTSKPSSIPGCVPVLAGSSSQMAKSAGAGSYSVAAAPVPGGTGPSGILIYSRAGLLGTPVQTGFGDLCLNQFARLGSFVAAPGGTLGACDGSFHWDFGAIAQATSAILPGDTLHLQAWYRDPPNPGTANLTQGVGPIAVLP
jgi:FG-GAP-like repeat